MTTSFEQLETLWRQADEHDRARFALEHALECLQAVTSVHPPPRRAPRASIELTREGARLDDEPLDDGEQLEVLAEPGGRWLPAWIEGLPDRPRVCIRLAKRVVDLDVGDDLVVRRPQRPDPALAGFVAERLGS